MLSSSVFAVTAAAQRIVDADSRPRSAEIVNPPGSTFAVYVGGADVTVANGRPIAIGEAWSVDLQGEDDDIYIIGDGATNVRLVLVT